VIELLISAGVSLSDGYDFVDACPIFIAKAGAAQWIVDFLISHGAMDQEFESEDFSANMSRFSEEDMTRQRAIGVVLKSEVSFREVRID